MLGAEERRLRRIDQYAARRSDCLPAAGGKVIRRRRTSTADDALLVIRESITIDSSLLKKDNFSLFILPFEEQRT